MWMQMTDPGNRWFAKCPSNARGDGHAWNWSRLTCLGMFRLCLLRYLSLKNVVVHSVSFDTLELRRGLHMVRSNNMVRSKTIFIPTKTMLPTTATKHWSNSLRANAQYQNNDKLKARLHRRFLLRTFSFWCMRLSGLTYECIRPCKAIQINTFVTQRLNRMRQNERNQKVKDQKVKGLHFLNNNLMNTFIVQATEHGDWCANLVVILQRLMISFSDAFEIHKYNQPRRSPLHHGGDLIFHSTLKSARSVARWN